MNNEELKAMLIIDMPDNCYQCSCLQAEISYGTIDRHICGADYHKITELYKRNNCPLKPIPEKKDWEIPDEMEGENYYLANAFVKAWKECYEVYARSYVEGWNDCIDEILGEEE